MKRLARERMRGGRVAENKAVCRLRRSFRKDLFHIFHEAHVEHFIRFVEHERADMLEVEGIALDQVEQTTGRANHDIHAAVEARDLRSVRLPAIDGQDAHIEMLAILGSWNRQPARPARGWAPGSEPAHDAAV